MIEAKRAIEAVLMVADRPAEPALLGQLLELSIERVDELCAELAQSYLDEDRGFQLVRVAGGYRLQTHPDLAPYVERFVLEGQTARLSAAALETLAIVAYKQPASRAQISAIRGVNADGVLRTLEQRGYVAVVAHDPGPGQAALYGTTPLLLERLGLDRIEDLPPLAGFVPGPEVMDALEQGLRVDPGLPEAGGEPDGDSPLAERFETSNGRAPAELDEGEARAELDQGEVPAGTDPAGRDQAEPAPGPDLAEPPAGPAPAEE